MKIELDFFTTTFHNFGRDKTTKWKSDKALDTLIYKELKKSKNKSWLSHLFFIY